MKKPLLLLLVTALFVGGAAVWKFTLQNENVETIEWDKKGKKKEKRAGDMLTWFTARAYPDPYYLTDKYLNGWHQAQVIRQKEVPTGAKNLNGMWNSIGPSTTIGGRILTIAVDPSNNQKLFAGSASGGIWKSTNGGTSWTSVSTGFPVLGVSSIIIHPTNSNIIYAGTGEVYRIDSAGSTPIPGNTSFAVWKTRGTYGIGILKSTDGGNTWSQVMVKSTPEMFAIQSLRFDPSNPNTIYAAATDGLYRSTNSGSTWTKLFNITYVRDVVVNGNNIVISVGNLGNTLKGIYKSTNGGSSWTKITSGLPATFQGYIQLGWTSASANTIVASIGRSSSASVEVYRSTDFGSTWTGLNNSGHCQFQYWFAHDIAINPSNTDALIIGGVKLYRYTVSTQTKTSAISGVHDDIHDIVFDPTNSTIVYVACDGGIYKSTNGGTSFSQRNNGLAATQFYASLGVSTTDPDLYVGGLQDNYQWVFNGSSWSQVGGVGGDGAACGIMPGNNSVMLVSRDARGVYRSTNGGGSAGNVLSYWGSVADSRTAFVAPLAWSKSNPQVVYVGSDNLHKSTNAGSSWTKNSYTSATTYIDQMRKPAIALAVSPTNENILYVSVTNFAQYDNDVDNIHVTGTPNVLRSTNGGTSFTSIKNGLPDRMVMDFAISAGNSDSVFIAVGGFGTSHVYVTGDGGASWVSRGAGLPDVPFNAILIDPVNPNVIYAGGDLGVYVSPNRGITWFDFNNGFWDAVQVVDLQYTADNQLLAATHGKGVFRGPRYSGILPVEIVSFTGETQPQSNKLTWKVAQEDNVSRYEIERSTDGSNFQKIGMVQAVNAETYTYTDVLQNLVTYYYRLRSVDHDGFVQYSDIIALKRGNRDVVHIIGNPFNNEIRIQFTSQLPGRAEVRLYDAAGKLLRIEKPGITTGQNTYTIDNLYALPAGTYFVEAIMNNQRWRHKVVKR